MKFRVNCFSVKEKNLEIGLSDGTHGGDIGFHIRTILDIFYLHPDTSYQVSSHLAFRLRRSILK